MTSIVNLPPKSQLPFPLINTYPIMPTPNTIKNYMFNITSFYELAYYHQAVKHQTWRKAMAKEIETMEKTKTWAIVFFLKIITPLVINGYTR